MCMISETFICTPYLQIGILSKGLYHGHNKFSIIQHQFRQGTKKVVAGKLGGVFYSRILSLPVFAVDFHNRFPGGLELNANVRYNKGQKNGMQMKGAVRL